MRVVVIAVGKVKERGLRDAIGDYGKRIGHYARLEEVELKDGPEDVVESRFEKAIPGRAHVVALEVDGEPLSSRAFAKVLERAELDGVSALVFLIGGAYGLPRKVSRAAHARLSLSAMTLPHRIARLLLFEQIYRGYTILRGEPYDH